MADLTATSSKAPERLFEGHCHVASTRFVPASFVDGTLKNIEVMRSAAKLADSPGSLRERYVASLQDHDCDQLVAAMDAAGVARATLLLPDFTYALRDCRLTIAEMFDEHAAILARHPGRFAVLAGADPRWGKDALDLFERGVDRLGFSGLKLYPPCGYRPDERAIFPFYEICAARGLPVLVHLGPTSPVLRFDLARPELVEPAAFQFPSVRFILAHAATAFTAECADLCAFRPNVYADVSGFQALESVDPDFGPLRYLLRRGIAHKLVFGTDWPVFGASGTLAEHVSTFLSVGREELGAAQLALVTHDNAVRLFGGTDEATHRRETAA